MRFDKGLSVLNQQEILFAKFLYRSQATEELLHRLRFNRVGNQRERGLGGLRVASLDDATLEAAIHQPATVKARPEPDYAMIFREFASGSDGSAIFETTLTLAQC